MSIFGALMDKLRGHAARINPPMTTADPAPAAPTATATAAPVEVDVEQVLEELAAKSTQKLDWRHSIVDLMKLVGMDSSLAERKSLAQELGYTGDTSDTATMNVWLSKQVMTKMSQNGGKVPANLLD